MIRKITIRGYNTSVPFKLFYLCDDDGVSDLAEAFKVLLLLPFSGDEELISQITYWTVASYKQELSNRHNSRPYYLVGDELEAWNAEDQKVRENLNTDIDKITKQLEEDLKSTTCILVPISMRKKPETNLRYFGNKRYYTFKQIQKLEKSVEEKLGWGSLHGWHLNSLERYKNELLQNQRWMKNAKLMINGEVTRHPCMMCTRALDSLEGLCAFGGTYCEENLGTAVFNSLNGVQDDSK